MVSMTSLTLSPSILEPGTIDSCFLSKNFNSLVIRNVEMAAGGPVEPFWEIYAVHKNNKEVLAMLEEYRIGNLNEEDVKANKTNKDANDPFANEPRRHPLLKPSSLVSPWSVMPWKNLTNLLIQTPFNAETPSEILADSFLTPNELFYVRNHLPTPDLEVVQKESNLAAPDTKSKSYFSFQASAYELDISGLGLKEQTLKLKDIQKLPKYSVSISMMTSLVMIGWLKLQLLVHRLPLPFSVEAIEEVK